MVYCRFTEKTPATNYLFFLRVYLRGGITEQFPYLEIDLCTPLYASFNIRAITVWRNDFIVNLSQKLRNNRRVVATIRGRFYRNNQLSYGATTIYVKSDACSIHVCEPYIRPCHKTGSRTVYDYVQNAIFTDNLTEAFRVLKRLQNNV